MSATAVAEPVAPVRSHEQRMEALEKANRIRSRRKELKLDVKARRVPVDEALTDPMVDTMKVYELLLAVPKFGRVKVQKILGRVRISPAKTVGGLSERQRRELLEALRPYLLL